MNARVLFGLLVVLLGSIAINILMLIDCAIMWPLNTRFYRRIASKCEALWIDCMAFALPSTTLHLSGDIPESIDHTVKYNDKKPLIIISNHMVDADWYFLWMVCETQRDCLLAPSKQSVVISNFFMPTDDSSCWTGSRHPSLQEQWGAMAWSRLFSRTR